MVQNISALTYQAISPESNSSVATIKLDPNVDLTWNVKLLGNVQDGSRNIKPKFLSIDNINGTVGVTLNMGNFSYKTPAYNRETTFQIPGGTQQVSFIFDTGATMPVTVNISEERIADNQVDQLKVQQQAAKTLVYNYQTITATSNQQLTDGNTSVLFKPILANINYNLLDVAGAPVPNGFLEFVKNQGTFNTTLVPAGAQTINGVYTAAKPIVMQPGDSGILSSDGVNWYYQGHISFNSAQLVPVAGGNLVIPHGLAIQPVLCNVIAHCITADNGYNPGDEVNISQGNFGSAFGDSLKIDATNITIQWGTGGALPYISTAGGAVTLSNANWRIIAKAKIWW